jgi:hypothetical protein
MNISTEIYSAQIGEIADRRGTIRFPVQEDLRYRIVKGKSLKIAGSGTTLNIGSRGILFTTQEKLPMGCMAEISVNWPARLDGTCPLQFVAQGRIVRSEDSRAAVKIERYEFRTRSTGPAAMAVQLAIA